MRGVAFLVIMVAFSVVAGCKHDPGARPESLRSIISPPNQEGKGLIWLKLKAAFKGMEMMDLEDQIAQFMSEVRLDLNDGGREIRLQPMVYKKKVKLEKKPGSPYPTVLTMDLVALHELQPGQKVTLSIRSAQQGQDSESVLLDIMVPQPGSQPMPVLVDARIRPLDTTTLQAEAVLGKDTGIRTQAYQATQGVLYRRIFRMTKKGRRIFKRKFKKKERKVWYWIFLVEDESHISPPMSPSALAAEH